MKNMTARICITVSVVFSTALAQEPPENFEELKKGAELHSAPKGDAPEVLEQQEQAAVRHLSERYARLEACIGHCTSDEIRSAVGDADEAGRAAFDLKLRWLDALEQKVKEDIKSGDDDLQAAEERRRAIDEARRHAEKEMQEAQARRQHTEEQVRAVVNSNLPDAEKERRLLQLRESLNLESQYEKVPQRQLSRLDSVASRLTSKQQTMQERLTSRLQEEEAIERARQDVETDATTFQGYLTTLKLDAKVMDLDGGGSVDVNPVSTSVLEGIGLGPTGNGPVQPQSQAPADPGGQKRRAEEMRRCLKKKGVADCFAQVFGGDAL